MEPFVGPVNTSVYQLVLFQDRTGPLTSTSAHTFVSTKQLPFLSQRRKKNDRRNYFMINLYESYAAELGLELATPGSAVRRATDRALTPSSSTTGNIDKLRPCSSRTEWALSSFYWHTYVST